mmetsp:Transcript_13945/g.43199  ORF Transcript_13945/g.43199 Transcript_13945/m.43199 type:complete len:275 (+) Transcript_13945:305-1129(+)
MPPPIRTESHLSSIDSMTGIFVDTLAPPRMAVNGRFGASIAPLMYTSSFSMRKPPAAGPEMCFTTPSVDACARCAVPNASLTYAVAPDDAASAAAKSSWFFVSPLWNRTFSSSTTPPDGMASQAFFTSSPTQSSTFTTSVSRSSESRPTTGATENLGSGSPLGRPMCVAIATAAPCSLRKFMVGTTARSRVSSVIVTPSSFDSGTFRSSRMSTRALLRSTLLARPSRPSLAAPALSDRRAVAAALPALDAICFASMTANDRPQRGVCKFGNTRK